MAFMGGRCQAGFKMKWWLDRWRLIFVEANLCRSDYFHHQLLQENPLLTVCAQCGGIPAGKDGLEERRVRMEQAAYHAVYVRGQGGSSLGRLAH